MTSNRLIPHKLVFDFVDEAERPMWASEPQRGQSDLAAMKKTALGSAPENLMEQIVEPTEHRASLEEGQGQRRSPRPRRSDPGRILPDLS